MSIKQLEYLQEKHKQLDRECTDLEKNLSKVATTKLKELKIKKLNIKDEITNLQAELNNGKTL